MKFTTRMLISKASIILIILYLTPIFTHGQIKSKIPPNAFEINCGIELYRNSIVGGAGYNIHISKNFIFLPAIDVIGLPIISGSMKFPIHFSNKLNVYPKLGLGFLPVGFFISTSWIAGFGVKHSFSQNTNLFIETKIVLISGDVIAIGPSSFRKKNVKDFPPIVLVVGWVF
jgi:hypothetical protein